MQHTHIGIADLEHDRLLIATGIYWVDVGRTRDTAGVPDRIRTGHFARTLCRIRIDQPGQPVKSNMNCRNTRRKN